jgi:hypothetical protein
MRKLIFALLMLVAAPLAAQAPDARAIVARAYAAAGGDAWAKATSLELEGRLVMYGAEGAAPRAVADDYRMWRVFETDRADAHDAAGQVRIDARVGGKLLFQAASDGAVSWNQKGVIPKAEADALWASNFGFGVIRHALKDGFKLARLPDDSLDGHPVYMVRVTDPAGTATLFGIDKASGWIRLAGFLTPRGWHARIYDDFAVAPGWTQPKKVTLYYNGVKQNEVLWDRWRVNPPLEPSLFAPANAGK